MSDLVIGSGYEWWLSNWAPRTSAQPRSGGARKPGRQEGTRMGGRKKQRRGTSGKMKLMSTCLGSGVRSCELGLRNLFMYLGWEKVSKMERMKVRKVRKGITPKLKSEGGMSENRIFI